MNYNDFVSRLATATIGDQPAGQTIADVGFLALLPQCIDYAEQRLYRELNLASTSTRDGSTQLIANSRNLFLPTGVWVVVQKLSVITPYTALTPEVGARFPLTLVSWDYLDNVYNSSAGAGLPQYWAMQDSATLAVGPWPDLPYRVEITGTVRPAALSDTNPETTLSVYFPDLLFVAAMIFMSGALLRNYGAQSDDPAQGVTWEMQYKTLMASAQVEEARKRVS